MATGDIVISTPQGVIMQDKNAECRLVWDPGFSRKWSGNFNRAQVWLDTNIVRFSDPLVPFQTGALKLSGQLGSIPGSGEVAWVVPYARRQYYSGSSRPYDSNRGGHWFARMKATRGAELRKGVAMMAGKGG